MKILEYPFLENSLENWGLALAVFCGVYFIAWFIKKVLESKVEGFDP
jgi:hypothetical protein